MNPWCQLCERLVTVADANTACQEILRVFYQLQDDKDMWTAKVGISTNCLLPTPTQPQPSTWVVVAHASVCCLSHFLYIYLQHNWD